MPEPTYFDTQALSQLVERCFDLAMSGAVPPDARADYLAQGKRLRELLTRVLSARFDAGSAAFQKASAALQDTNKALDDAAQDMARLAQAVDKLTQLAGYIDQALGAVTKVIS